MIAAVSWAVQGQVAARRSPSGGRHAPGGRRRRRAVAVAAWVPRRRRCRRGRASASGARSSGSADGELQATITNAPTCADHLLWRRRERQRQSSAPAPIGGSARGYRELPALVGNSDTSAQTAARPYSSACRTKPCSRADRGSETRRGGLQDGGFG